MDEFRLSNDLSDVKQACKNVFADPSVLELDGGDEVFQKYVSDHIRYPADFKYGYALLCYVPIVCQSGRKGGTGGCIG